MRVLVIGCGTFGLNIAVEMDRSGHEVSVVDSNYNRFEQLPDSFRGKRINGDALVRDVLDRANAGLADAVVLTPSDDVLNLSLARMFQEKFHTSNIIALNTKPEYRMFYDKLDTQTISMVSWGVLRIEEQLTNRLQKSAYCLGATEVGVYNVVVPDNGVSISTEELQKVTQCLIFALTHEDVTVNFTNELTIVPRDILHVSTNTEGLRNLYMSLGMKTREVTK